MLRNGQVATQYVDLTGVPTMDQSFNPNGSVLAIEGITSPDGRVFGKMGHSERSGEYLYNNVTGGFPVLTGRAQKAPHLGGAGERSETERVIFRRKTTNVTA